MKPFKTIPWATLMVLLLGGMVVVHKIQSQPKGSSSTAYTLVIEEHRTFPGPSELIDTRIHARRPDGTFVGAKTLSPRDGVPGGVPGSGLVRTIYQPDQRQQTVVYDAAGAASTMGMSERAAQSMKSGPADPTCITSTDTLTKVIGQGTLLGYPVVKKQALQRDVKWDFWDAPAVGCEHVYARIEQFSASGSTTSVTEQIATQITVGPPSDQLFDIPATAKDLPPSELFTRLNGGKELDGRVQGTLKSTYDPMYKRTPTSR